jgi:Ser/Thr protein kinase RdoA (MazF antagonist)
MFQYYRISSNAIYPFRNEGKTQLLRFAPKTEKCKDQILAELDFVSYLRTKHYGVLESVVSKNGEELVEAQTPWGEYFASVFKRVSGVQMNQTDFSDTIVFNYGKALGKLHHLSSQYTPTSAKRWSYHDVLDWIQDYLMDFPQESAALKETKLLRDYFSSFPITKSNYGLIHYDFECDNVFYDPASNACNVIDFDDSMYHWYVMDIEIALESLQDDIPSDIFGHKKQCFWDGYRTEYDIGEDMALILPACRRFSNLYGYVRILRSIEEKWSNEPDWLIHLRERLTKALKEESAGFGMEI